MRYASLSQNKYYAPTAYDSSKPRRLPPTDNSKFSHLERVFRRRQIVNHGSAQCREFFSEYDQISIIRALNSMDEMTMQGVNAPGHGSIFWTTLQNPKANVDLITRLMLLFSVISWVFVLIVSVVLLFLRASFFLSFGFLQLIFLPALFTLFHFCGKLILKANLVQNKNNVHFNRRRGIVSIPRKNKAPHELPFDEFDGYIGSTVNPSGSTDYHLIVAHRYSSSFVQNPGGNDEPWKIFVAWECLQQYMDISKPLPDIPSMEPYRERDPVTAEYDQIHGRPKDYWKKMDLEKAKRLNDISYKAASQYPWGLSREQAIVTGWRPSGCGEGDWRGGVETYDPVEPCETADPDFGGRLRIR